MEVDVTRRGVKKELMGWWWEGYKEFGLSREEAQSRNNSRSKSKGLPANPGLPRKIAFRMCLYVL